MGILGIGLFKAYKTFSGYDPSGVSPIAIASNFLDSEKFVDLLKSILTVSPDKSIETAKEIFTTNNNPNQSISNNSTNISNSPLKFKFAIISDSHTDITSLKKALAQAKSEDAKFIVGLGDFSDVGTISELEVTKKEFDGSFLNYYVTAGDHDLWDSRDKGKTAIENFNRVFQNPPYLSFTYDNIRVILIYNADNYEGLDTAQLDWIESELLKDEQKQSIRTFVFAGIPLYHPSSDHVMGKTNPKLKNQADHLISIFKKAGVDEIVTGDTHFYTRYIEPKSELKMTSVGAVTSVRNPQAPRFVMVDILEDGSYNIRDTEIR